LARKQVSVAAASLDFAIFFAMNCCTIAAAGGLTLTLFACLKPRPGRDISRLGYEKSKNVGNASWSFPKVIGLLKN
jgi:hypothetical protein